MHVFAPSSARGLLRELKRFQTSFSGHKCIKNVGGRAPPGPAGELKRPPLPPIRTCGRFAVRVGASRPWRQGAICRGSSCQNYCLAAGLHPDLLSELRCFPDLIFRPQHHQKGLATELRPDPLGELKRSPRSPSRKCDRFTVGGGKLQTTKSSKGLAAGLRQNPLDERSNPTGPQHSWCNGREHSSRSKGELCGEEGGGVKSTLE